jgi:hypothetical protein
MNECDTANPPSTPTRIFQESIKRKSMEQKQSTRTKWLNIRMTEEEFKVIENLRRQSTTKSLSEYARKTLMGKPVVLRYRNQSLDDFMTGMLQLQKDLKVIRNDFDRVIRGLRPFGHMPEFQQWILLNEQDKTSLLRQIDTISNTITKSFELWSHA